MSRILIVLASLFYAMTKLAARLLSAVQLIPTFAKIVDIVERNTHDNNPSLFSAQTKKFPPEISQWRRRLQ